MKSPDHIAISEKYGAHNYHPLDVVITRGKGVWVYDVEGKKYLDCLSAYSALNFGHQHPDLIAAAEAQLKNLTLTSRAFYNDQLGLFCKELAELCGLETVLPMTSGAEAVETSIKIARRWAYRKKGVAEDKAEIICFSNNFHGRTVSIVSFSTAADSRLDFGPFTPGFIIVPFGNFEAVKSAMNSNTAAVLVEPIQGEAGIIMPPDGFLKGLADLCRAKQALLLADEIQTGFFRAGNLFACDYEQVRADLYIVGKSLGGGITPISAVIGRREVMDVITPGSHGSTFGGNPLACAVARAVIKLMKHRDWAKEVQTKGDYIFASLRKEKLKKVKDIRGRGLMIGIELRKESGPARPICEQLLKRGILCKDTHEQTMRLAPPLIIDRPEIDFLLKELIALLN